MEEILPAYLDRVVLFPRDRCAPRFYTMPIHVTPAFSFPRIPPPGGILQGIGEDPSGAYEMTVYPTRHVIHLIPKKDAPDLGSLNVYGEQGVDPHANGVVALWGAVHNPNIIGENKTPVFLVHGTDDETVLFKTGRPLANARSMVVNMLPNSMALLASLLQLNIGTPTLYGSFVIDSVLKAKNIEHETYFVDKAYHEFYDEVEYEKPVRTKVFDFLYKLATSDAASSIGKRATLASVSRVQMLHGNRSFIVSRGMGLKFNVVDLRGRSAMSGKVSAGESVDLSTLKNGVYVLRVQGERAVRFGLSQ